MATLKKLTIGQKLYKTYREKMGNTTISTTRVSKITVTEIGDDFIKYTSLFSQSPRRMSENNLRNWRVSKPLLVESFTGAKRLANKNDIKALKEKALKEKEK